MNADGGGTDAGSTTAVSSAVSVSPFTLGYVVPVVLRFGWPPPPSEIVCSNGATGLPALSRISFTVFLKLSLILPVLFWTWCVVRAVSPFPAISTGAIAKPMVLPLMSCRGVPWTLPSSRTSSKDAFGRGAFVVSVSSGSLKVSASLLTPPPVSVSHQSTSVGAVTSRTVSIRKLSKASTWGARVPPPLALSGFDVGTL